MKNKGKVLVVFVLGIAMLFLVSCENTDEIRNLEMQNKELVEKLKVMEEANDSLSREIESLENDLNFLKFALEHCSSLAFTKDSLYRIDNYLGIVFIKEFTREHKINVVLAKEDIVSFLPSYDNRYIALISWDYERNRPSEISVYEYYGEPLVTYGGVSNYSTEPIFTFGMEKFLEKGFMEENSCRESLEITGYSKDNEYLFGIVHSMYSCDGFWSINLTNGELTVYTYDQEECEEFRNLQKEYLEEPKAGWWK